MTSNFLKFLFALALAGVGVFVVLGAYDKSLNRGDLATRGLNEMQRMRFDLAQKEFADLAAREPQNADARYSLAWAQQSQGHDTEALAEYSLAEKLAGQNQALMEKIYSNRGAIYVKRGDFQNAASSYNSAVKLNLRSTDNRFQLGTVLLTLGKKSEAMEQFRIVKKLDPTHGAAAHQLDVMAKAEIPEVAPIRNPASIKQDRLRLKRKMHKNKRNS